MPCKPMEASTVKEADSSDTDRRNAGAEVLGNSYQLGMGAVGSHPITYLKIDNASTNGDHGAHVAVTKGKG